MMLNSTSAGRQSKSKCYSCIGALNVSCFLVISMNKIIPRLPGYLQAVPRLKSGTSTYIHLKEGQEDALPTDGTEVVLREKTDHHHNAHHNVPLE